jgi:uncharacterized membrane protein
MAQGPIASSRIASLTDGIFAIAMTLLVLTIEIPAVDSPMSSATFRQEVASQMPGFTAWLISFAILCRLWISQYRLFDREVNLPPNVTTVNFVFLGIVSFIPYPTSLVSEHPQQTLSVFILSAVFSVAGVLLAVMWRLMEHGQMDPAERAYKDRVAKRLFRLMLGVGVVACLLALVDPRLGILIWIAVPILAVVRKKRRKPGVVANSGEN